MHPQLFATWINDFYQQAAQLNERRLIMLSGDESWAHSLIESTDILSTTDSQHADILSSASNQLVYGDSSVFLSNVSKKRYRDKLGSESEIIIFADSDFTIDAFAALSGTLKAGGLFFLIVPRIDNQTKESLFFKRFYSLIQQSPCHAVVVQNETQLSQLEYKQVKKIKTEPKRCYPFNCITEEQYHAVEAIKKVVTGRRKRPLVLTADRGRGKSSALAIACAQLMQANEHNEFTITITAPDLQALSIFFQQLKTSLPQGDLQGTCLSFGKAKVYFMAVDQLLKHPQKINLLLVDEAAAIPVYLLEELLNHYHRMVFSSTVHGYEGAGRGFTLKFQEILSKLFPQWSNLHLKQPIRWRLNDPLEQLVFDTCLLNAELPDLSLGIQPSLAEYHREGTAQALKNGNSATFKIVTAKELIEDEDLLRQVFAILVTAHYQTKPSDLKLLLDNQQVQLACLFSSRCGSHKVIAVALLMSEGVSQGISRADISAVKSSERRLRNNFLPQSLLSHCGFEQAFDYQYLRIMRIAVHPQLQQQGIGSILLAQIQGLALKQGVDFIGTSFGVSQTLLSFWIKAGFSTARVGFTKDKASGEHSALLLTGVTTSAVKLQKLFAKEFYRSFDYLLLEEYKSLTPELVYLLLIQQTSDDLVALNANDIANINAYARGERLYSSCAYSLYLWFKHDLLTSTSLRDCKVNIEQGALILIARLLQKHSVEVVCQQYGFTGKKMLNHIMQSYVSLRLNNR